MKRLILYAACVVCPAIYGQNNSLPIVEFDKYDNLDSVRLKFTYKLSFVEDVGKPDVLYTDMQVLEIGDNLSKYYSRYFAVDYPEYVKTWQKKSSTYDAVPANSEKGSQPYEIYKDYPAKGVQTVADISRIGVQSSFIYEEPVPALNWLMNYEFSTILGYRCQKATTSFRGRKYIAWFTTEIPVSNGPWKFGGLPGLIMKVTDSEGHYDFECVGIEQPNKEIIKFYKGKYSKTSRKDYLKLYHRYYNDLVGYLESMGIPMAGKTTPNGEARRLKPGEIPPSPYNPIERE